MLAASWLPGYSSSKQPRMSGECIVVCCGDLEARHRRDGEAYTVKAEGDKAIILWITSVILTGNVDQQMPV